MRKLIIVYIIVFALSIIFSSCSTVNTTNLQGDNINNHISYLSSDSLQGRLVGTDGNKKAEDYIVKTFKDLGIQPYSPEDYLQSYKHKTLVFNNNSLISIANENKKQVSFTYGEDYLESAVVQDSYMCTVTNDKNDINMNDSFIVLNNNAEIGNFISKAKGILVKSETLKKYTSSAREKGTPIIQISEKMYNYLSNTSNLSVTYNCSYSTKEFDANNVIGLIPGSKHEKALILSAHFDHVGTVGDYIYNGAIDNSSGTAILLDLANKLQSKAKEAPFEFDIYICALNGEEAGLQGSKSFVSYIKDQYSEMVNINLDTLGDKSKEILILGDEKLSHTIVHLSSDWLKQNNKNYRIEAEKYTSDHVSFQDAEIPSITLGQDINDIIHSVEDKIEEVDVEFVHIFSNLIYEFIIDSCNKLFDVYTECDHTNEERTSNEALEVPVNEDLEKLVQEARNKLKFGEYIVINKYDRIEKIYNNRGEFNNLDDLLSVYPEILSPYNSKVYCLERIIVFDNNFPDIDNNIAYDKVYKNELKLDNILSIEYFYGSLSNSSKLRLSFHLKDDQQQEISPNSKSEIITNNEGQQYTLVYNPDGKLIEITSSVSTLYNEYMLIIRKGTIKDATINGETYKSVFIFDWNVNDNKVDIMALINSIDLNIFPQ
jgi:hypothetical protein